MSSVHSLCSIVTSGIEPDSKISPPSSASRRKPSASAVTTIAEITPPAIKRPTIGRSLLPEGIAVKTSLSAATAATNQTRTLEDIEYSPTKLPRAGSRLQRSSSERIKDKAKAFVRRMPDLMRASRRGKHQPSSAMAASAIEISAPTLVGHESASPASMRMLHQETPAAGGLTALQVGARVLD